MDHLANIINAFKANAFSYGSITIKGTPAVVIKQLVALGGTYTPDAVNPTVTFQTSPECADHDVMVYESEEYEDHVDLTFTNDGAFDTF